MVGDITDTAGLSIDDSEEALREDRNELNEEMAKIMAELEHLYEEPDYATGQAFVTFNYEADKNKLLKMFNPPVKGAHGLLES